MVTNVNKLKIKTLLLSIGAGALIGNSISIYITFLQAYFNNYKLTICVNLYGEAIFEFIFIPIILIIGIWTIYYLLKKYLKKEFRTGKYYCPHCGNEIGCYSHFCKYCKERVVQPLGR